MTPSSFFFDAFLKGNPAKDVRMSAARGALPLAADEVPHLLVLLTKDEDPEVASQAAATLQTWPRADVLAQLRSRECPEPVLWHFARSGDTELLEAVALNPAIPSGALEEIASRAGAPVLECILYNRARLLAEPAILQKIKSNPEITPEMRRVAAEIEREFFGDKKTDYSIAARAAAAPSGPEVPIEAEPPPEDLSLEGLPVDPAAREGFVAERLAKMSVREKIQVALLGPREARSVLIRDTNRQISHAALDSPKLSDSEVEAFAAMRNVSDDILRELGTRKTWLRNYAVVLNLVKNPKTPPMVSQRLIMRLQNRDLQGITRDRAIPEMVRHNAQRTLDQRLATKRTR